MNGYSAQRLALPLVEIMKFIDINGDAINENVVDLGEQGDRDLRVLVPAATVVNNNGSPFEQNNFASGDEIDVIWSGKDSRGVEVSWSQAMKVINQSPAQAFVFRVPNDKVKALAGSTATLFYQLTNGANSADPGRVLESPKIEISIFGLELPAPVIVEAVGDSLDPAKLGGTGNVRYATVNVDYPGMSFGDTVEIYRNGQLVESIPISDSNLKLRPLRFQWPQADLSGLSGDIIMVYYVVYRGEPEQAYTSRVVSYRVGPSLVALPPFINELTQGRLESGTYIGKIYVHIPPAATLVGDMVNLYWVGAGQAGSFRDRLSVSSRNVNGDLKFDVYDDVIAPNARRLVKVYYTITRLINGRSVVLRSPELIFFVGTVEEQEMLNQAGGLGLIQVKEAPNGNLDTTKGVTDAMLAVPFATTQVDDVVSVYWKVDGEIDSTTIGIQTVNLQNVDDDLNFIAPAARVQSSLGKRVSIYYVVKRRVNNEELHLESPFTVIRVGPLSGDQLLAPKVVEADVNDFLDPMHALAGVTIVVPAYPGMAIGDIVKVTWNGGPGPGSLALDAITVRVVGPLTAKIPATAVAYSLEWEVLVSYEVTRVGQTATIYSPSRSINVQGFYDSELPVPRIAQAPKGVLDLSTATDPITVVVDRWPLIASGQRFWLKLEGVTNDNKTLVINARTGEVINDAVLQSQLSITIAKSEFAKLRNGSQLKVFFKVAWDAAIDESEAILFPSCQVDIKQAGDVGGTILSIDSRDLNLGGFFILVSGAAPSSSQYSAFRTAFGGRPPYRYTSANPAVALVDSGSGKVSARGNGITIITVTDQDGATVTYRVIVSGVYALEQVPMLFDVFGICWTSAIGKGLRIPTLQEWRTMKQMNGGTLDLPYVVEPGVTRAPRVWTLDVTLEGGLYKRVAFYPATDKTEPLLDFTMTTGICAGETAHGFGLRN